jgi:hypothetical protein
VTKRPSPAELATMSSRDLVLCTLAHHASCGPVGEILQRREPDDQTARVVVEAYEAGRAPAWLTAYLLGCLRGRVTYALVRGLLESAPGLSAEVYAGVAMARIAGMGARGDLLDLMRHGQHRRSREGAAYGLGELRDPTVAPSLVAALREGRIERLCAGSVIASLRVPGAELAAWLRSPDEVERTAAIDAVFHLSAQLGGLRDAPLARAAREALRAGTVRLSPSTREMLEARLASLLDKS